MNQTSLTELPVQPSTEATPNNPRIMGLVAEVEPNLSSTQEQAAPRKQDIYRTPISQLVNVHSTNRETVVKPTPSEVESCAQLSRDVATLRDYVSGMGIAA